MCTVMFCLWQETFFICEKLPTKKRELSKVSYLIQIGLKPALGKPFKNECIFGNTF